jgi:hypothetical protein
MWGFILNLEENQLTERQKAEIKSWRQWKKWISFFLLQGSSRGFLLIIFGFIILLCFLPLCRFHATSWLLPVIFAQILGHVFLPSQIYRWLCDEEKKYNAWKCFILVAAWNMLWFLITLILGQLWEWNGWMDMQNPAIFLNPYWALQSHWRDAYLFSCWLWIMLACICYAKDILRVAQESWSFLRNH